VFEITRQRGLDLEMLEQFPRVTGVLCRDKARFTQNADRARGEIFEIADGGGDKMECAHAVIVSSHRML